MAIVSTGYDGTIDERDWAALASSLGSLEQVASGFDATVLTSPDRGLSLTAGVGVGHGVRDVSDTSVIVTCGSTTSSRWDTVVLRRDWAANTTSVVVVGGQSTKRISSGLNANPGVLDDQPLFLARVQSGSSAIVELQDVRVRASALLSAPSLLALPAAPVGAQVLTEGRLWSRRVGSGGSEEWWDGRTDFPVQAAGPGWQQAASAVAGVTVNYRAGHAQFYGQIERVSARSGIDGDFSKNGLTTTFAIAARPPGNFARLFHCAYGSPGAASPIRDGVQVQYNPTSKRFEFRFNATTSTSINSGFYIDLSTISWYL